MEIVGQALVDMRDAVDPRVTLEVALVRLAAPAADTSPSALLERIERLERVLNDKAVLVPATGADRVPPAPAPRTMATAEPEQAAPLTGPSGASSPLPSSPAGPAQAKAALGALLRGAAGAPPSPAGVGPAASLPTQPSAEVEHGGLPTRDELTKAWGDTVLARLERSAQAYLAPGRFTEVSDAAVFALPDAGWVARANRVQAEAEAALERYFGRPVPLRLVVDQGLAPPKEPEGPMAEEDAYDLDELSEAPALEQVSPEQRVLEFFPGAVVES
jgi:hypothetical protein